MNSIIIIGKRWFERINGNTYHSCRVFVDGEEIGFEPFHYGYDNSYMQTGSNLLQKAGLLNLETNEQLWSYCQRNNIILNHFVSDVKRKRDLF